MVITIILSLLAVFMMFVCVLKYPTVKIKNHKFDTFYMPLLFVALMLLVFPVFDKSELFNILFSNSVLNPLKILALFMCVSVLSILLDETGFFAYIATVFIKKYKDSQVKLFITIYFLVSILTIFTSNDVIILTFTPFIIHFSKQGKINPIPYLVMEFVAANTYSMALAIGNPTNIYLSSIFELDFISYFFKMIVPTIFCGITSIVVLLLLFKKTLKKKIELFDVEDVKLKNKPLCLVAGGHLIVTIVLLAISNYVKLDMWSTCFVFALSLLIIFFVYALKNKNYTYLKSGLKRVPYNLIPFILSMFTIIMALDSYDVFDYIYDGLNKLSNETLQPIVYLITSTISCNIVNNIPMSLAYGSILSNTVNVKLVYATIIGSNLGALFTPVGALAGIMWVRMLKENDVKYSFLDFMKNGSVITLFLVIATSIGILIV